MIEAPTVDDQREDEQNETRPEQCLGTRYAALPELQGDQGGDRVGARREDV